MSDAHACGIHAAIICDLATIPNSKFEWTKGSSDQSDDTA